MAQRESPPDETPEAEPTLRTPSSGRGPKRVAAWLASAILLAAAAAQIVQAVWTIIQGG